MRMSSPRFSSLPSIRFVATYLNKTGSLIAGAALALTLVASAFVPYAGNTAHAQTARQQLAPTPFLTLPFEATERMSILSGWYYSSSGGLHNGIDYINGSVNRLNTWKTFPVIASADGEACGNCTSRQGNAVWVKHNVNGVTYYTYYGHLASISDDIPLGSQSRTLSVKRGQFLGWAGDTGARGALHLHFALYTAGSRPLDPYGIGKLRQYYPQPNDATPGIGWFINE
jgi:murein DD-endopeptidase MepM/ murein hydrolase activator NlpD